MATDTTAFENAKIPELGGLTLSELRARQATFRAHLKQALEALPPLSRYTSEERATVASLGAMRGGEKAALLSILDASDAAPGTVSPLGDRDGGEDDAVFETGLLRARLEAATILQELEDEARQAGADIGDTAFTVGLQTKPLILEAYGLLKPAAAASEKVKRALALALDFFRSVRRARPTRPSVTE